MYEQSKFGFYHSFVELLSTDVDDVLPHNIH